MVLTMPTLKKITEDLQIEAPTLLQIADYLRDSGVEDDLYVAYDLDAYEDSKDLDDSNN